MPKIPGMKLVQKKNYKKQPKRSAPKLLLWKNRMIENIRNGEGKTPGAIAFEIYNCKNQNSAHTLGCENMRKLQFNLHDMMKEYCGLTDIDDLSDLADLRKGTKEVIDSEGNIAEIKDNHARVKALELSLRLKGVLQNNNHYNTTINNTKIENTVILNNIKIEEIHGDDLLREIQNQLSAQVRK